MFGSKKKSNSIQDETLNDNSKKIVTGVFVLIFTIILILILEVYTFSLKGSQAKKIAIGQNAENKSKTILNQMGKIGKEVQELEYEYIKSLETIMSPMEFQNFKNSISGLAGKNNVQINNINEGKTVKVRDYVMHSINLELLSGYTNYVNFKEDVAKTPFRVNFDKEIITRETPTSSKIKISAKIDAVVYEKKEKLFTEKKKFIEKMKRIEEKKLAREKKLKELQDQKKN